MIALVAALAVQSAPDAGHIAHALAGVPAIRREFDAQLLDYPSARFRDVRVTINLDVGGRRGSYFCGYVNGKNRMGAYTGWTRFMASTGTGGSPMVNLADDGVTGMLVQMTCDGNVAHDPVDRSDLFAAR